MDKFCKKINNPLANLPMVAMLMKHLKFNGNLIDEYTTYFNKQLLDVSKQLEKLGWKPMSEELFNKLEEGIEQGKIENKQ